MWDAAIDSAFVNRLMQKQEAAGQSYPLAVIAALHLTDIHSDMTTNSGWSSLLKESVVTGISKACIPHQLLVDVSPYCL